LSSSPLPHDPAAAKREQIEVTVTFPLASKPAYRAEEDDDTHVSVVLAAALEHFGLAADPQTQYYLADGGKRIEGDPTLGELADNEDDDGHGNGGHGGGGHGHDDDHGGGRKRELKLTLVKVLVQG
jgi:hypothetical protein